MSAAGRALSEALDKPEDWSRDAYYIKHKPSGQSFWIANGSWFFDGTTLCGTPKCLGLIERHWLYRKANRVAPPQRAGDIVVRRFQEAKRA